MQTTGFLSFNKMPPRIHLASDDTVFDPTTLQHWRDEGFSVTYHHCDPLHPRAFETLLQSLPDDLELGESYALVAYGRAAELALELHTKPAPHMCVLVAYYPDAIATPGARYPGSLRVLVHLAGSQAFSPAFRSYRYPGTQPGFAEWDLEEFDNVAARLSWGRSLAAVRRGFGREVDLEGVWEEHVACEFMHRDAAATVRTMRPEATVLHVPTAVGAVGQKDLLRFYNDFFIPSNPQSLNIRLVSRTMGVDQIVDEMFVSLRHTQEIDWLLPGVPPTNKQIEIILERLYWDQASVLVQIGLLDPKLVPDAMKAKGMKQLPVLGKESARKVLDFDNVPTNELVADWAPEVADTTDGTKEA